MSDKRGKVFLVQCFIKGSRRSPVILDLFGDIKSKGKEHGYDCHYINLEESITFIFQNSIWMIILSVTQNLKYLMLIINTNIFKISK